MQIFFETLHVILFRITPHFDVYSVKNVETLLRLCKYFSFNKIFNLMILSYGNCNVSTKEVL